MSTKVISIAKEYSETPAGRYYTDGPYSGERFREEFLLPALNQYAHVEVNLDGTLGYGSSFLEEAFGGLIRVHNIKLSDLRNKLTITSTRRMYYERVFKYLEDAEKEIGR